MQGAYYQEAMGMKRLKMHTFIGAKGTQSCTGRPISASTAPQYRAVNGNSRAFATLPSSVQR